MSKDYVVVTTISQFRHRYVMRKDDLQKLNPDVEIKPTVTELNGLVMEKVKEFSQYWLGETVIDTDAVTEDEMLELFDQENDYLRDWTRKSKIDWVRKNLKGKDAHG